MFLIYNEGSKESFTGTPIPYHKMPATRIWLKHFENALYLKFMASSPLATSVERTQAHRELTIADKKMAYWAKHPNYSQDTVTRECERLKKDWIQKP